MQPTGLRVILGFVGVPIVAGLATFPLFLLFYDAGHPIIGILGSPYPDRLASVVSLGAAAVGVVLTSIIGVPVFAWMRARGRLSLGRVILAGVVIGDGAFAALLVTTLFLSRNRTIVDRTRDLIDRAPSVLTFGLFIAIIAATTAASFWLIAIRGSILDSGQEREGR